MFSTNRQYQRNKLMRDQYKGLNLSLSRLSYWLGTFKYIKIYFVYEKLSCWLTNHTQLECNNLIKQYGNYYPEYKARLGYKRNLQCQIPQYEGINNDEDLAHYLRNLSIDIHNNRMVEFKSFYTILEQFSTFFVQLKGSESKIVVNTLVDNTFKHQIILSNKTVPPITFFVPYVFNLSTDLQYNDTKFKGLLFDLGISSQLMGNIGQLKAIQ